MKKEDIPIGWRLIKLGEYVEKQKGKKPKHLSTGKSDKLYLPYVDIKAFEEGVIVKYTDGEGCVICEDNDFLIVWDGSRSGLVGKAIKGALGSTLVRVNFPDGVLNDYAFYFLKSKYLEINSRAKGSGTPHVDPDLLWNYNFPLPPLPEQHRIVAKIEELFSELDNAVVNLIKAKAQLKTYRQAVLKWAFEGKLTEEWRKERSKIQGKSTNELRDDEVSLAAEEESKYNAANRLPKNWKWVSLGEICEPNRKCSYGVLVPGEHIENGIKLLRVGDIDDYGKIDQTNMKSISPEIAKKYKRTFLKGGEVVISLVGAIGRTAVVPESLRDANTARAVGVIPVSKKYSSYFVEFMLRSPSKIREHDAKAHEVARKTLNLEDVVKSLIPIPEIEEQHQIVQEIETRFSVTDKLEQSIDQSLQQAEALRQSILKRAFEGRLVKYEEIQK